MKKNVLDFIDSKLGLATLVALGMLTVGFLTGRLSAPVPQAVAQTAPPAATVVPAAEVAPPTERGSVLIPGTQLGAPGRADGFSLNLAQIAGHGIAGDAEKGYVQGKSGPLVMVTCNTHGEGHVAVGWEGVYSRGQVWIVHLKNTAQTRTFLGMVGYPIPGQDEELVTLILPGN